MSSNNNTNVKRTSFAPIEGPYNKKYNEEKHRQLATSSKQSEHKKHINEEKGKQSMTSHVQSKICHVATTRPKSNSMSPTKRKLTDAENLRNNQVKKSKKPAPLVLPPPTIDEYSFLKMLSSIIQKHLAEKGPGPDTSLRDEKTVEYSRKDIQPIVEDIHLLLNETSSQDDPYLAYLDNYTVKPIIDATLDFDPIVSETIDEISSVKKEETFNEVNIPVEGSPTKSPSITNISPKDYSSWLVFDNDGEFIKFKDGCELIESAPFFSESTQWLLSEIEQSVRSSKVLKTGNDKISSAKEGVDVAKIDAENKELDEKCDDEKCDDETSILERETKEVRETDNEEIPSNEPNVQSDSNIYIESA